MSENWNQHIGDDQLIYGLPKHMEAVAGQDKNAYWEIVPNANACATCRSMRGLQFPKYPGPVHPNCNCEIVQVAPPERQKGVVDYGFLQGDDDTFSSSYLAGQKLTITFQNLGPFWAGAEVQIDGMVNQSTGKLTPGLPKALEFTKFGDTPMTWQVFLRYRGFDGSSIWFEIQG